MASIAAAREGCTVLLLERTSHIGGLPANGLGATDIATRQATRGLFWVFISRVREHYSVTYGPESPQAKLCAGGYRFEPSVAELVLEGMIAEQPAITVRRGCQFDALPERVEHDDRRVVAITVSDRKTGRLERCAGEAFIDATYEGDLAAAAGASFRTRREGPEEYGEFGAGIYYCRWGEKQKDYFTTIHLGGDHRIQAYNYRLCLTDVETNRVPIPKPLSYDRNEYLSLADDLRLDRATGAYNGELEWDGIGRVVNMVATPNGKTDSNNQHLAFISTDLPEENQPWPTASWAWRDAFSQRLRDYTLGLLWFIQHDEAVPESYRVNALRWGLAKDEFIDNGNFPRQVYVREGRRIEGEYLFTAKDAIPVREGGRPPVHGDSVTASHYPIDSHACRKREPGRPHLDGFLSLPTRPYTVPYRVIIPRGSENMWVPVAVSATHLGFGTLRMEPCWMALGEAAGEAAALAVERDVPARLVPTETLQDRLLDHGAQLVHIRDLPPEHPCWRIAQLIALRGGLPEWEAKPDAALEVDEGERWARLLGADPALVAGAGTRGEAMQCLADFHESNHSDSRK